MRIALPAWKPIAALAVTGAVSLALLSSAGAQANQAPTPQNDAATTAEDTAVSIAVLANDTDPDGNTLSIASVGLAADGTAAISGNSIIYTPRANFHGTDAFNYVVTDGDLLASALVTVTVTPVNDAPEARDDTATVRKDQARVIDVLANDRDVDGDTMTLQAVSAPAHGTAVINGGKVTYTPATGYVGSDAFTYVVSDGALSDTAVVSIAVKDTTKPVSDHDARVAEACATHSGQPGLSTLCSLYLDRPEMPSWARHVIGKNILKMALLASTPDRVVEACSTSAAGSAVAQLCALYRAETTPSWLRWHVGRLVLKLTAHDSSSIEDRDGGRTDVRDQADKRDKQDKRNHDSRNKHKHEKGQKDKQAKRDRPDERRASNAVAFDRDGNERASAVKDMAHDKRRGPLASFGRGDDDRGNKDRARFDRSDRDDEKWRSAKDRAKSKRGG
ncbi:MAG: Ig-like domain-containing protein [Dehalococcoidia bacterium]|nr:Ig-like domain-containing protein [Dehalococcoidia bacterium]